MPKYILVATPQIAFGELIRISLEEGGNYRVRLVQTSAELLSSASHTDFAMAILDSDLGEESFISLAQTLKEKLPKLFLVVIPPENNPNHPSLSGIKLDGYLTRPFYLPDLIQMIEGLLGPSVVNTAPKVDCEDTQKTVSSVNTLPWIKDTERVSEYLVNGLAETAAHAAVVISSGKIWSSAGKFAPAVLQEIVAAVNRYWVSEEPCDMARYVHLETDNLVYLVYASYLGDDFILALAYDVTFPLSQIRAQTNRLSQAFKTQDQEPVPSAPVPDPVPAQPVLEIEPIQSSDSLEGQEEISLIQNPIAIGYDEAESVLSSEDEQNMHLNLAHLLAEMPSPDPDVLPTERESHWVPEISDVAAEQEEAAITPRFPWEETGGHRLNPRLASSDIPTTPLHLPDHAEKEVNLNPDLTYICILIPCLPQNLLTGPLANKLGLWVPELCGSFGWKLEGLAIQPEYMQWVVRVDPTVSPSGLVRIIRQNTTIRISSFFDQYRINDPEADFWAPGYLMARGSQPPAPEHLQSYIERTRRNQGYSIPASPASETST